MKINKAIRKIMLNQGVSLSAMAAAIGKARGNDISARLVNDNMSCNKAVEMLNVLGYNLVVKSRNSGEEIVIDQKDDKIILSDVGEDWHE